MRFFGDDPLRGFLCYFVVTLLLCYLARWSYRRRTPAAGVPSALSKNLYTIALLISPIVAYQLVNIDDTYGYYRYFKAACDKDGGDYVAEHLEKIESIAVHPIGLTYRNSGEILDYARYYFTNDIAQNFEFIEFQFDSTILRDADSAEAFYMGRNSHRLLLNGQPVRAGFYRVENLCRSSVAYAWRNMDSSCFRVKEVAGLESPYLVTSQMERCDVYSGLFRLCSIKWHLIRRENNTLVGRSVMYAYSGGWRNKVTYPDDPVAHESVRPFKFCGGHLANRPKGILGKILSSKDKNDN